MLPLPESPVSMHGKPVVSAVPVEPREERKETGLPSPPGQVLCKPERQ